MLLLLLCLHHFVEFVVGIATFLYRLEGHNETAYVNERYDAIIVGGGAAGCVVARTLSDAGASVLLIERGDKERDGSLTLEGLRDALLDDEQTQSVLTTQGVRSHVGAALGGGTAVNVGIWIEEDWSYFAHLNKLLQPLFGPTPLFHPDEMHAAFEWVRTRLAARHAPLDSLSPELSAYGTAVREAVSEGYGPFVGHSPHLQPDKSWSSFALFSNPGEQRRSAASLLRDAKPNLTVLLNSTVLSLQADSDRVAQCVVYRMTTLQDHLVLGHLPKTPISHEHHFHHEQAQMAQEFARLTNRYNTGSPLHRPSANGDEYPYRVCLKDNAKSEIILSAGALATPLLLMHSGIGPRAEIEKLRSVPVVAEIDAVGKGLQDRPLVGISFFLKEDTSSSPSQICRVTALGRAPDDKDTCWAGSDFERAVHPFAEISGGTALQGVLISSRLLFPPHLRNTFVGDIANLVLKDCFLKPVDLCSVLAPLDVCLRQAVSWWTFLSHIHSRGQVKIDPRSRTGMYELNYLQDPRDRISLRNNVRKVLRLARQHAATLAPYLVSTAEDTCPMRSFETEADIMASVTDLLSHATARRLKLNTLASDRVSTMPFASFPQYIPDEESDEELDEFIEAHFASMWHFVGSVQLGAVLDANFRVPQVRRLSVIDASVLPVITRMNPTASLLAMARMAGERKAAQWSA